MNKTKILFAIFVMFMVANLYGGPFGVEMGMKIEEIDKNAKKTGNGMYEITVPKPHNAFKEYIAFTCPSGGIFMIKGLTGTITSNVFGEKIKSEFDSLEKKLKKIYGENKRYDFLRSGSIWSERQDWMMALRKEDRTLAALWSKENKSKLTQNINGIKLQAYGLRGNQAIMILEYQFNNMDKCIKELEATEDSSL